MNRTTATVLGLREKLAEERALTERLRNNISKLSHENARLEMEATRLLRRAAHNLTGGDLARFVAAFKLPAHWNE